MRETEVTVQVYGELEDVKNSILSRGFELTKEYEMTDYYFTQIADYKSLIYKDLLKSSLIVRTVEKENSKSTKIVYKNKEIDECGNVVSEEKTELLCDDADKAIKIFESAGLHNWCVLKNRSFVYDKGPISFALQSIDGLGTFIECEENAEMENLSTEEKLAALKSTVNDLGLNLGDDYSCKKPYLMLHKM